MSNQILSEATFSEAMEKLQRSPRRKAILLEVLSGHSDKDIAETLGGIHEGTVRKQISLICEAFGLQGSQGHAKRADLVALFAKYRPEFLSTPQLINVKFLRKKQVQLIDAPDTATFYGRTKELEILQKWLIEDKCRLVSVYGIGGIGKSTLTAKLATLEKIQGEFDYLIWLNLNEAPLIEKVLEEIIKFLSQQQATGLNTLSLEEKIAKLLHFLRSERCLLILDNFEALLNKDDISKSYRNLLKRIGESSHKSCLVITSRENPEEVVKQEARDFPVHGFLLEGLNSEEACIVLNSKEISGSTVEIKHLVEVCSGNPLALKILATYIRDLFNGRVADFIASSKDFATFIALEDLLEEQFNRIEKFEKSIMYWLAINRERVSFSELLDDLNPKPSLSDLIDGIKTLRQCSLVEVSDGGKFTLQPIVMEYVINRLVKKTIEEIKNEKFDLFKNVALIKATAKDYIRQSQVQRILKPIAENLVGLSNVEKQLLESLQLLKNQSLKRLGYLTGNILNLLCYMDFDFSDLDFSDLPVWQAHLKGKKLHGVNFTNSDLTNSIFTQTFGTVLTVASSLKEDYWAMGDTNNEIRLWKGYGQQVLSCKGHTNWIRSIAFSPDGRAIASASDDQTIRLWSVETGQCLNTLPGHSGRAWSVIFSPDGKTLASGDEEGTIKFWDVNTGQCLNTLTGHTGWVQSVTFSPDGAILASGSDDNTIKFWDVNTGQCLNTLTGHTSWVRSVMFSPDGTILASGSDDNTIKFWDVNTGQCLNTLTGHTGWVRSVMFSPDGTILASGGEDKTIKLWDVKTFQCLNTLENHRERVWSVTFSFDGNTLITSSDDKTVRLWDTHDGKCLKTLEGYTDWAWSVCFSPDGKVLASSSEDKTIRLWNVSSRSCFKILQGHTNRIRSVAFSSDGKTIASGSDDTTVRLWDFETGQCLKVLEGHSDRVLSVTFNHDGKVLASAGDDRKIRLWKFQSGQCILTLEGHSNWIWSVAFSPDGEELASASEDKQVKLWEVKTGLCLNTWKEHSSWVRSVVFSPDGKILASAGEDRTIRLWDVVTGRGLQILRGHTNWIRSIAFSPDGKTLASAGQGKRVRLWNVETAECYATLKDHSQRIWTVTFAPDGKTLASGSEDGTIRLWDLEDGNSEPSIELRTCRLYEGMKITGVKGLTEAEVNNLIILGAEKND